MSVKHETPEVLKTKLKEEVALIGKLKSDLATAEQRLQDVIGAYILGAQLPQQGIRFDENFDLIYDTGQVGESNGGENQDQSPAEMVEENQDESPVEMAVVASKSPQKKPKIR